MIAGVFSGRGPRGEGIRGFDVLEKRLVVFYAKAGVYLFPTWIYLVLSEDALVLFSQALKVGGLTGHFAAEMVVSKS